MQTASILPPVAQIIERFAAADEVFTRDCLADGQPVSYEKTCPDSIFNALVFQYQCSEDAARAVAQEIAAGLDARNAGRKVYANRCGFSDVYACEVVRVVSAKTIEVRELKATLLNGFDSGEPDALQFSPGGFFGHTSGTQRYSFESDPTARVVRVRLCKYGWKDANGSGYSLSAQPRKVHDYNF